MKQFIWHKMTGATSLAIALVGVPLSNVKAQTVTLDNFNEYTSASYIQGSNTLASAQQGTNGRFLRFGTAVSDGLYSSAAAGNGGGTGNRGAVANASFTVGSATLYTPELFFTTSSGTSTTFSLSSTGSCVITLDMKVSSATAAPNLTAFIQVQDAAGQQYQSAGVAIGAATTYQTFSFNFAPGTVTNTVNVSATDSLANVLANASELNFVFRDTLDTGSLAISFDNLTDTVTGVPEPSTWMTGALMTAVIAVPLLRRSLHWKPRGILAALPI